ncbi:MFS transporter [Streptomyces sp. NPDC056188]|uniref:MFS transporter n=1 Tax=Streptomyces sp. NPDC056188 TaxID=3345740 RepID=UPI0035D7A245
MSSAPPATSPVTRVSAPAPTRSATPVGFLVFVELASGIAQGWIAPLLPDFMDRYGLAPADANWIAASALLASVVWVPLLSKLGDVHGHKRLLVVTASLVTLGSLAVAIAPTFALLLVGRVLQGAITAFLPLEFAIVRERAGEGAGERADRAIGLLVGSLTVGGSLGLLFSGIVVQYLGLSATLWLPAVMMAAVVPLLVRLVPEATVRRRGGVDWPGAVLLAAGLVLVLGAVGNGMRCGWLDPRILGALLGGTALLAVWIRVENRAAHPLVPLDVIRRGGQGLPLLTAAVFGAHLIGSTTLTTLFLATAPEAAGYGLGLSGAALGAALLVFGTAMFLGTASAARITRRLGRTGTLVTGALFCTASYLATAAFHDSLAVFLTWQATLGFGAGWCRRRCRRSSSRGPPATPSPSSPGSTTPSAQLRVRSRPRCSRSSCRPWSRRHRKGEASGRRWSRSRRTPLSGWTAPAWRCSSPYSRSGNGTSVFLPADAERPTAPPHSPAGDGGPAAVAVPDARTPSEPWRCSRRSWRTDAPSEDHDARFPRRALCRAYPGSAPAPTMSRRSRRCRTTHD